MKRKYQCGVPADDQVQKTDSGVTSRMRWLAEIIALRPPENMCRTRHLIITIHQMNVFCTYKLMLKAEDRVTSKLSGFRHLAPVISEASSVLDSNPWISAQKGHNYSPPWQHAICRLLGNYLSAQITVPTLCPSSLPEEISSLTFPTTEDCSEYGTSSFSCLIY